MLVLEENINYDFYREDYIFFITEKNNKFYLEPLPKNVYSYKGPRANFILYENSWKFRDC